MVVNAEYSNFTILLLFHKISYLNLKIKKKLQKLGQIIERFP